MIWRVFAGSEFTVVMPAAAEEPVGRPLDSPAPPLARDHGSRA